MENNMQLPTGVITSITPDKINELNQNAQLITNGTTYLYVITPNTYSIIETTRECFIEDFSEENYNLIVVDNVNLCEDTIYLKLDYDKSIKPNLGTNVELYEMYKNLTQNKKKEIKNFPALVISKNGFKNNSDKCAAICKITKLQASRDGIFYLTLIKVKDIYYKKDFLINNASKLEIKVSKGITEFDEVHWAIKNANAKDILQLKGDN